VHSYNEADLPPALVSSLYSQDEDLPVSDDLQRLIHSQVLWYVPIDTKKPFSTPGFTLRKEHSITPHSPRGDSSMFVLMR